ncbi:MAG: cytochrome c [Solirubrobacterales bacterium]
MFELKKAHALVAILALVGTLLVAGCGGGGTSSSTEATTSEEEGTTGTAPGAEAETPGESAPEAEGKEIFVSTCATCHTLKAAGASGEVGPNLDELEPDLATVEHQVINGGGGMAAFGKEKILSKTEVKAVATYVSSVAGSR